MIENFWGKLVVAPLDLDLLDLFFRLNRFGLWYNLRGGGIFFGMQGIHDFADAFDEIFHLYGIDEEIYGPHFKGLRSPSLVVYRNEENKGNRVSDWIIF